MIADNRLTAHDSEGGGLAVTRSTSGHTVLIDRTTFSGNIVDQNTARGGGLHIDGSLDATVRRSTFSANRAWAGGGALLATWPNPARIEATTFIGDLGVWTLVAGNSSGISLAATIVAPAQGQACNASPFIASAGWNIADDASCNLTQPTDRASIDPLLAPLADNGGPTRTALPLPGSPALDAIPQATAGLCDASLATDQRGSPRPQGPACDIGAAERP